MSPYRERSCNVLARVLSSCIPSEQGRSVNCVYSGWVARTSSLGPLPARRLCATFIHSRGWDSTPAAISASSVLFLRLLPGWHVPHLNGVVPAAADDSLAVRTEGHACDTLLVP